MEQIEDKEEKSKKVHKPKKLGKKGFSLIEAIIIIIITAVVSATSTGVILYNTLNSKSKSSYKNLTSDEYLQEFIKVYDSVTDDYYEDVDKKSMLEAAMSAMMDYLGDSYTTYLNEDETKSLSQSLNGTYKGIGISIKDKTILKVYKSTPAYSAGLQEGDIIKKINEEDCDKMTDDEIASTIKSQDSTVKITIERDGIQKEYELELDNLNLPAITYEVKENNIGYLYISTFSASLATQVKDALEDLETQNIKSLIIDVRDNAGGYLIAAQDVASLFIEKGKPIYSLQAGTARETYNDQTDEARTYPIVVLINKNSASASEILAAALKESYGATLVGVTSYGKGKVQQTQSLSDGGMVKYTTAKWLTPNGKCIDGTGLTPDVEVELEYEYDGEEIVNFKDTQLEKAIEILKK